MPLKYGIILIGIFAIIDLGMNSLQLAIILHNDKFDAIYGIVFGLILIPLAIACVFFLIWFCKDNKKNREFLTPALVLATVTDALLFVWILVYICFIYPNTVVYLSPWDRGDYLSDSEKYSRVSKAQYLLAHVVNPLLGALSYALAYCFVKPWVVAHRN